jgi:hypothetical protein
VSLFPSDYWDITDGESVTLQEAYQSSPFLLLIPSRTPSEVPLVDVKIVRTPWGSVDLVMLVYGESGPPKTEQLTDSIWMVIIIGRNSLPPDELDSILRNPGRYPFGEVKVLQGVPVILAEREGKLEGVVHGQDTIVDILLSTRCTSQDLEMVASSIVEQIRGSEPSRLRYRLQSFWFTLEGNCSGASVTQVLALRYLEGPATTVSLTLPYGNREIVQTKSEEPTPVDALTAQNEPLLRKVEQTQNETMVTVALPHTLGPNEEVTLTLKYYVCDLPGDLGISRSEMSFLDRLMGRWKERILVTYVPGIFRDPVDELLVRIITPLDYLAVEWEPASGSTRYRSPVSGRTGAIWHLEGEIPTIPRFNVLAAKPGKVNILPLILLIATGLLAVVGLDLLLKRRKGKGPRTSAPSLDPTATPQS